MDNAIIALLVGAFGLIGVIGVALLIAAVVVYVRARAGGRGAIPVQAEVYDHGSYVDRGQQMYFPRYRAVLADGQVVTGQGTMASNAAPIPVGSRVNLVYDASDPKSPLREPGMSLVSMILVASFAGIGVMMVGTSFSLVVWVLAQVAGHAHR
jgi:hypothetical protein